MSDARRSIHVAYDHQIFSWQEYGGISRYFVELADRMTSLESVAATIVAPLHVNAFLREHRSASLIGTYAPPMRRTARVRALANDALARVWFATHRPSLVHETYYRASSLARRGTPTVLTVYDMIHERFPGSFPGSDHTSLRKRAAVARADAVICISERTRQDLLELLPVREAKVAVVHLAHEPRPPTLDLASLGVERPYLLYVGLRRGYKNFAMLLEAIAGSDTLRHDFPLVCFGGGDFTPAERELASDFGLDPAALLYRGGDDSRLATLYANAAAFVYPSLYEGFGIPLLEAMGYRCPIACSDASSMPEVAGDAAEYFDPTSPESLAVAVLRIVGSETRADELRRRGTARLQSFSWESCVTQTRCVYESVL